MISAIKKMHVLSMKQESVGISHKFRRIIRNYAFIITMSYLVSICGFWDRASMSTCPKSSVPLYGTTPGGNVLRGDLSSRRNTLHGCVPVNKDIIPSVASCFLVTVAGLSPAANCSRSPAWLGAGLSPAANCSLAPSMRNPKPGFGFAFWCPLLRKPHPVFG